MCVCVCVNKWACSCMCTRSKQTEDSLWYGRVPQGAGIWHIVFVGNSNHLQLSTCFDPFRKFHFLRWFGEWLERSLWKEKPHYGFSVSWRTWLVGQCQSDRCSFPVWEFIWWEEVLQIRSKNLGSVPWMENYNLFRCFLGFICQWTILMIWLLKNILTDLVTNFFHWIKV